LRKGPLRHFKNLKRTTPLHGMIKVISFGTKDFWNSTHIWFMCAYGCIQQNTFACQQIVWNRPLDLIQFIFNQLKPMKNTFWGAWYSIWFKMFTWIWHTCHTKDIDAMCKSNGKGIGGLGH
jgi:hypothetical protein